ncbi:MAG: Eco57I restriction-modification methylase domain-containing protein [Phormidesmis sp.]
MVNAQLDLATAVVQLRSHRLSALFTQSLGWQSVEAGQYNSIAPCEQQCQPIAHRQGVTVWQVSLTSDAALTASLRAQVYEAIAAITEQPLVIFTNAANTRSLWCQSPDESALYISGQPITLWEYRLRRLRLSSRGLFPALPQATDSSDGYETFAKLVQGLFDGISGISNTADRKAYAALTLQRLILAQAVQQRGWLNGDTWYLQTCFGVALQQGKSFFETLQRLYQSLALPNLERPLALQTETGTVPFLGHLFDTHRLERQYGAIAISNPPFEAVLGWLSEQASVDALNPWMSGELGYWLERYWAEQTQPVGYVGTPALARELSDRTLDRLLLDRLDQVMPTPTAADTTLNDRLFNADSQLCRHLIQEILPDLRLLDPACGSGNLLVAIHQRLTEIFSILIGHIQQTPDPQLKLWRTGLIEQKSARPNLLHTIQKRILKNNLYGVELRAGATETAHFQLWLHTVAIAQHPSELEPLTDLTFNVMSGNALIGLLTVDEARFDQISAGKDSVLQGNLLQPLVADSYQTTLAEKNLALEHYKSRNQLLAAAKNIPPYARAALLREDILRLDIKAQNKLDALLLNHMSQQLGIQYKAAQLTDKPQRRPLTSEDIDILQPFHWGYHFNKIIRQGGFDAIVCAPPWGTFKPTAEEFFQRFQDLSEAKGVSVHSLKTSKQALAKGDPEVTQAWLFYQNQYAYVADYFYRSEQYTHQNPLAHGKPVRNQFSCDRLFIEQCFNLLQPGGIAAVVLPGKLSTEPKAQSLHLFLQDNAQYGEVDAPSSAAVDMTIALVQRQTGNQVLQG